MISNQLTNFLNNMDYGMYTRAGNLSIENKAKSLINKLEKENITADEEIKAVCSFVRGWRNMFHTKTMSEASDTAVIESVWYALTMIGREFSIPEEVLNWAWEKA